MPLALKVATFTVRATAEQAARWNRAAAGDAYPSVGSWLAYAADAYLKARLREGRPLPLAWHRGVFLVTLEGGETPVRGHISPPFGFFPGTEAGADPFTVNHYTLTHLSSRRIIATLASARQCKALAAEMAPVLIRDEAEALRIVDRRQREES